MSILPETPALPEIAVLRVISPLLEISDLPVVNVILPPESPAPVCWLPAVTRTSAPVKLLAVPTTLPTLIIISPERPPAASPELKRIEPELPVAEAVSPVNNIIDPERPPEPELYVEMVISPEVVTPDSPEYIIILPPVLVAA